MNRTPTEAQKAASRANGAKSRGPRTPEGKCRSAMNRRRRGLLAACVVLPCEARTGFDKLLQQHLQRFAPADGVEVGFVEEMASAWWRMRRAWSIETTLMTRAMDSVRGADTHAGFVSGAFESLAASPALAILHRYEANLHRIYRRAFANLRELQASSGSPEVSPVHERTWDVIENEPAQPSEEPDPGLPLADSDVALAPLREPGFA